MQLSADGFLIAEEEDESVSPVFFETYRREPSSGQVVLTPGEKNELATQPATVHGFEERPPQSEFPCRPSRHMIAFYLSPFGEWSAEDFLMGNVDLGSDAKAPIPRPRNVPLGRLSTQDDRRNVNIPPRITYGSLVGENEGVAPYGLD